MMLIQIVLVLFFLMVILKVLRRFRAGDIKGIEAVGWVFFWLVAVGVVSNPNSTSFLAKILGVGRGVDAVIYLSIALLFFLVFKIFVHLEKIERQITRLTRQDALDRAQKYENPTHHS
ncbi:MAG: hypothetical protein A2537_01625 [Candidatus Magasanikbacteria bacterium RIFOXYD2_FULL_36_9]|uniref:DUF2304 domain-containing protein n=1 Tax=Candidatus Magasanikbacteria bacterium RIFOXYD2_FULL_36_9 TaxID=1798707 RepID=A0A1F6NYS3_9BACT|nr:MAG: hypothetical protein A2537_01625 [Candidatus Magasanikbacteria bacterium RIFOXYD2_FULL_36_9]